MTTENPVRLEYLRQLVLGNIAYINSLPDTLSEHVEKEGDFYKLKEVLSWTEDP
jgi:hypothetical protein